MHYCTSFLLMTTFIASSSVRAVNHVFFVFQGNALNFINENLYFLQKKESGVFLFGGGISRIQVD